MKTEWLPPSRKSTHNHSVQDDESDQDASFARKDERFAYDLLPLDRLFGQCAIRLNYERNRFVQIVPDFIQSCSLRIGARKLFDEADKSLRDFLEDGGKFHS